MLCHHCKTLATEAAYFERRRRLTRRLFFVAEYWETPHRRSCPHKAEVGCQLHAVEGCCSCADQRPVKDAYKIYVDGQGMVNTPNRWEHYCPGCRLWHAAREVVGKKEVKKRDRAAGKVRRKQCESRELEDPGEAVLDLLGI